MSFLKNIATSTLSDTELVQQYKQSNSLTVLVTLYARYMELVYGVCLNYLKDTEQAKDATLAIFEELVPKLLKHEVLHFKNWLYQLAKNHCLMQLRADKKFLKAPVDVQFVQKDENVHLNGELDREENFKHLEYCLAQLNTEQRQVVDLFYLQSKSYKEIETLTGFDVNTVRSYLQNGRRNLKICMDKQVYKATRV